MKNALTHNKADQSAPSKRKFTGTDNPCHLRAFTALLSRPVSREGLDYFAGCSNGPELVAELRRSGLDVPYEHIDFIDRDGCTCSPGVYSLSIVDRRKINAWLAKRQQASVANAIQNEELEGLNGPL
jgi:hypothetical protein